MMKNDSDSLKEIRQLSKWLYHQSGRLNGYLHIDRNSPYADPLDETRIQAEIRQLEQLLTLLEQAIQR